MSQLHFAQLSDTHIRKDYSVGLLSGMFTSLLSPDEKLRKILSVVQSQPLDFIVISGDLVHEGEEVDYHQFKKILDESRIQVPVLLALGNHDNKEAFCNVFEQKLTHGRYYYFYQIREWKIVVLDSADREHGVGEIDDIQIEWLERIYDKKDKIVIFVHHPLFWDDYLLQIGKNGKRLQKFLSRSNVKGIFCGHVHRNSMKIEKQICQFTVESSACGFDYIEKGISEQERSGYLSCIMDNDGMKVENCICGTKEVYQIPKEILKEVLDKKE